MTALPVEPRRAKASLGVSSAALALACGLIAAHEGMVQVPYVDRLGRGQPLTVCYGETKGVQLGKRYAAAECRAMLEQSALKHAGEAQGCLPPNLPPKTAAAFYSFAYNIGSSGFCRSSVSRKAMKGDLAGACRSIGLYVYSNGKDCRLRESRCSGIVKRRADEMALCLEGV